MNRRKITDFNRVKNILGMPEDFTAITEADYAEMLNQWKTLVVQARTTGDTEREVELNNCKAWILKEKRKSDTRFCPRCGERKNATSARCGMCARAVRSGVGGIDKVKKEPLGYSDMSMNMIEIIGQLRREREAKEEQMQALKSDVERLTAAINALDVGNNGTGHVYVPRGLGISTAEIVKKSALEFVRRNYGQGIKVVFDNANLKQIAGELYPDRREAMKTTIYAAITKLINENFIRRVPGGLELTQPDPAPTRQEPVVT